MVKRLLFTLCLLGAPIFVETGWAQTRVTPDCVINFSFTATGSTPNGTCGNNALGISNWVLAYSSTGFSAVSIVVQSAPDNVGVPGSWVTFAGTVLTTSQYLGSSGVNPNTATTSANVGLAGYFPWMRVTLTSKTGTGTIKGSLYGYLNSTLAKAGSSGGAGSGGVSPTVSALELPKFRAAIAKTRDGQADTKIAFLGDSTTKGTGGSDADTSIDSYVNRIKMGGTIPISNGAIINNSGPRCVTSGFSLSANGFAAASAWQTGASGSTLVCTPAGGTVYDSFDIYYLGGGGFGTFTAQATGGASSGTISTNLATGYYKTTVTGTASTTIAVTITSTNTSGVFIAMVEGFNSTVPSVRVASFGVPTRATADFVNLNGGYGSAQLLALYAPNLTVTNLGINDAGASVSAATYTANLQTIINYSEAAGGDALLMSVFPSSSGAAPADTFEALYEPFMQPLATTNNIPLVDIYARFGSAFNAVLMSDPRHPNNLGYWDAGAALSALFMTVLGPTCTSGGTCQVSSGGGGPAGGDLSGFYPNPTVAKVNGITPGGTCPGGQFANVISTSAVPTCATPAGGGSAGGGVLGYSSTSVTVPAAGTTFFAPVGGAFPSTTESNVVIMAPAAAAISNMYVTLGIAPGVGNTISFTFRDAGASTPVTCTIATAATSCQDTTHSFTPAVGDALSIQVVTTGAFLSTPTIRIIAEYGVTGGGNSWFGGTLVAPIPANWTQLGINCAPSTVTGVTGLAALKVVGSVGAQNTCGWKTTVGAGDFSHVFVIYQIVTLPTFSSSAVGFTDGTNIEYCGVSINDATGAAIISPAKATALVGGSLSAANGVSGFSLSTPNPTGPTFFRLTRTGTNLGCDFAPDGVNWINIFNDTTPFLTASSLYVGIDPRGSSGLSVMFLESYQ